MENITEKDEEARELGVKIVSHIRDYTDKIIEGNKVNWSCYATPAEGLSGKFVLKDKTIFGEIKGVTDKDYYTNSYHVPVGLSFLLKKNRNWSPLSWTM